jgi:hypothetical protein
MENQNMVCPCVVLRRAVLFSSSNIALAKLIKRRINREGRARRRKENKYTNVFFFEGKFSIS